jgi:hypothetical protein
MSEPGKIMAATTIAVPMPHATDRSSSNTAHAGISDLANARIASRARALRLSQQLQITTIVDESGRLKDKVELHYNRGRGGTIQPVTVRIGQDAPDAAVLADGGVLGRCREYNAAIDRLHQLGLQLATVVREGRVQLAPGTALASTHAELVRLDTAIAQRQATQIGHSVVRLDVLVAEIAHFQARDGEHAPIVQAAERSACATWDGDTQDIALDGKGADDPGGLDE